MEYKVANRKYLLFIVAITAIFATIICMSAFSSVANKGNFTKNYDQVVEFGEWYIKVSNALYIPERNTVEFTFNVKARFDKTSTSKPEIYLVTTNRSYKTGKEYYAAESERDHICYVVNNVEEDFSYITVSFSSQAPDTEVPDSVDEFGDVIPGSIRKGETTVGYVRIDISDMTVLTSQERNTFTTQNTTAITSARASSTYTEELPAGVSVVSTTTTTITTTTTTAKSKSTTSKKITTKTITAEANAASSADTAYIPPQTAAVPQHQPTAPVTQYQTQTQEQPQTQHVTQSATTVQATTTVTTQGAVRVNGIRLETNFTANNIILAIGQRAQTRAVINPTNADNKTVSWTSNRPDIAVVDGSGNITAVSKGKAIITATTADGGLSASCMVTVQ